MKIISFAAENFMRLHAVEITPTTNVVELNGKNGNGKTSILTAIVSAFAGAEEAPKMAIRAGHEKASVKIVIGGDKPEYIIEETFRFDKNKQQVRQLKVYTPDGAEYKSPQTLMNSLWNKISIDPLTFADMLPKDQFTAMQQFVPGVDFGNIAMKNAADFTARAEQNRIAKDSRAQADGIMVPSGDMPEAIDERALVEELEAAGKHNADIETRRGNRERAILMLAGYTSELESTFKAIEKNSTDLDAEIERLRRHFETSCENAKRLHEETRIALASKCDNTAQNRDALRAKLDAAGDLPAAIDTSDIKARIDSARATNASRQAWERRSQLIAKALDAESKAQALTEARDAREAVKQQAIMAAKLPVEGLGFGEGEILYNGVPFAQSSDADKLRVSLAVAMAASPKLKVIRVHRGSLLDDDSMKIISSLVIDKDYQVWVEKINATEGSQGFLIEDGYVKESAS